MGWERLARKVHEVKEDGNEKGKGRERRGKKNWERHVKQGEKIGGRKENVQKQRNVETIMEERPMKLNSAQPLTSRQHEFWD